MSEEDPEEVESSTEPETEDEEEQSFMEWLRSLF